MQFLWVCELIGEVHQLKNERAVLRFDAGKVLTGFDHYLGDADFVAVF